MVQTHALFLVQPALRVGEAFHWLNFVDGLVAPTFLFAAGFSLGLTQVRAAQANDSARRLRKTASRLVGGGGRGRPPPRGGWKGGRGVWGGACPPPPCPTVCVPRCPASRSGGCAST